MNRISLVMPYYRNASMLAHHYEYMAALPLVVKDQLEVLIVDDGSPKHPASEVPRPQGLPELRIYRVTKDIPWNQHGARNLGAWEAKYKWLFMTDIDHVPHELLWLAMIKAPLHPSLVYTFDRREPDGELTRKSSGEPKPHVNTFLVTREAYWAVGGYDEDYCGMYGTDGLFRSRLYAKYSKTHVPNVHVTRYGREHIEDASTHEGWKAEDGTKYERRPEGSVKGPTKRRRDIKAREGRGSVIVTINFPWERVL